jgi:hypothetical protein
VTVEPVDVELLQAVRVMRGLQRAYFRTRSAELLRDCKRAESLVDKLMRAHDLAKKQPDLPF